MRRLTWTRLDALRGLLYVGVVGAAATAIALLPSMRAAHRSVTEDVARVSRGPEVLRLARDAGFDDDLLARIQRVAERVESRAGQVNAAVVCPSPAIDVHLQTEAGEIPATLIGVDFVGDPRIAGGFDAARVSAIRGEAWVAPAHVPGWGSVITNVPVVVTREGKRLELPFASMELSHAMLAGRAGAVIGLDIQTFRRVFAAGAVDCVDIVPAGGAHLEREITRELIGLAPGIRNVSLPPRPHAATWARAWNLVGTLVSAGGFVVATWVLAIATSGFIRRRRREERFPLAVVLAMALTGFVAGWVNANLLGALTLGVGLPRWIEDAFAVPVSAIGVSASLVWAFVGGVIAPLAWEGLRCRRVSSTSIRPHVYLLPEAPTALAGIALFSAGMLLQPTFGTAAPYLAVGSLSLVLVAVALLARPAFVVAARAIRRSARGRDDLTARALSLQLVEPRARLGLAAALLTVTVGALTVSWMLAHELHIREGAWIAATSTAAPDVLGALEHARVALWRTSLVAMLPLWILALAASTALGPSCLHDVPPGWRSLIAWGVSRDALAKAALEAQILVSGLAVLVGGAVGVSMAYVFLAAFDVPTPGPAPLNLDVTVIVIGLWAPAAMTVAILYWRGGLRWRIDEHVRST